MRNLIDLRKVEPTILIASITAISYFAAFMYEYGHKTYYNLPLEFIELNVHTLTKSLSITLFSLGAIMFISMSISNFFLKVDSPYSLIPVFAIIVIFMMIIYCAFMGGTMSGIFKEEYTVITQKNNNFVVVSSYDKKIILAPVNIEKQTITPKFKVVEYKDIKELLMVVKFENGLDVEKVQNYKDLLVE